MLTFTKFIKPFLLFFILNINNLIFLCNILKFIKNTNLLSYINKRRKSNFIHLLKNKNKIIKDGQLINKSVKIIYLEFSIYIMIFETINLKNNFECFLPQIKKHGRIIYFK